MPFCHRCPSHEVAVKLIRRSRASVRHPLLALHIALRRDCGCAHISTSASVAAAMSTFHNVVTSCNLVGENVISIAKNTATTTATAVLLCCVDFALLWKSVPFCKTIFFLCVKKQKQLNTHIHNREHPWRQQIIYLITTLWANRNMFSHHHPNMCTSDQLKNHFQLSELMALRL